MLLSIGVVNFYNNKKRFGAIATVEGTLAVFHGKDLEGVKLSQGDTVSFLLREGQVEGTLTAYNIKLIHKQEK